MRIAFVEMDTHAEIVQQFMLLCQGIPSLELSVYVSPKIQKRLPDAYHANLNICKPQDLCQKLKNQSFDLLIIGTLHRHFDVFYQLCKEHSCAVIVHNRNFHEASLAKLLLNMWQKDIWYRLKLLIKEKLYLKNKIREKLKKSFVLDPSLASKKPYQALCLFFTQFEKTQKSSQNLRIVVPGTVDQSRRDYQLIIAELQKCHPNQDLEICFLGKASFVWVKRFEVLKTEISPKINLLYFDEKVAPDVFAYHMQKADFLWCPIKEKTIFMGVVEHYGATKYSGNIGDAIAYGQWAVFPKTFNGDYPFVCKSDDFSQILAMATVFEKSPKIFPRAKLAEDLSKVLGGL